MGIQQQLFNTNIPPETLSKIKSLVCSNQEPMQKLALQIAGSFGLSIKNIVNEHCLSAFNAEKIASDWSECYVEGGAWINGSFQPLDPNKPYIVFSFVFVGLEVSVFDNMDSVCISATKDGKEYVDIIVCDWGNLDIFRVMPKVLKAFERFMADDFYPLIKTL